MGVMLPDQLIWIMEKFGLEWPDIDEDEVYRAAEITRTFRDDLEELINIADRQIVTDVAAGVRSVSGNAHVTAWNTNRSQNLQQLLDVLDPVAFGINAGGHVIEGLKWKVYIEVGSTALMVIPMLSNPLTAGLAIGKMAATKFLTGLFVDAAVSALIDAVDEPVIAVMKEVVPAVMQSILDAPLVEDLTADLGEIVIDLQVLEQSQGDMARNAEDAGSLVSTFIADIAALNFTGD